MWILYGAGIIPAFYIGMIFGGFVASCALGVESIRGIVAMICYHKRLDKKYVRPAS